MAKPAKKAAKKIAKKPAAKAVKPAVKKKAPSALMAFAKALASGKVTVVDLTAPLGPNTPVIQLPPGMGNNTPKVEVHALSKYNSDGPYWAWNWLKLGEHTGTHFDAPIHWITGKDYADGATDTIPVQNFVAPVNVIDCSREVAANPDFLLTADGVRAWEKQHGRIEPGSWVLMRSDWYPRNADEGRFLNANETGPHSPGPAVDCIEYIIARGAIGWGSECIGTDAGQAFLLNPAFPAHNLMHKANRYGLASLVNLDKLPPKGAVLIAAPLKFEGGTGSPLRVMALAPKGR